MVWFAVCVSLVMSVVTSVVRKILYFVDELEKKGTSMDGREKAQLYDKLGDLCCALKAYPAAVKFYNKQVRLLTYPLWWMVGGG